MGIGADYVNDDNKIDLFFTNIGEDTPRDKLSLGDIKDNQQQDFQHTLLLNKGDSKEVMITLNVNNDISGENRSKLRYAREHFKKVNALQQEQTYYFKFLSPISYDLFFKALRNGTYQNFKSELEAKLDQ